MDNELLSNAITNIRMQLDVIETAMNKKGGECTQCGTSLVEDGLCGNCAGEEGGADDK